MYNFIVCCDRKSKIMVPTCSCSLYQFLIVLQIILLVNTVCSAPTPGDWSTGAGSTFAIPAEEARFRQNDRGAWIGYKDETNDVVYEKTETGKYGEGFVGPAVGYVYHVTDASGVDHRGCEKPFYTSWSKDKLPLNDGQPWIALIKRGGCNFEVKVKNAFEYNAAAVLVYDDNHKDHLDRMKLNTNVERNMSAVFTYKNKGEDIAELVDKGSHVLLNITVGSHFSKPFPNINRTSVLFVSISFIVLMIISLTWLIFYYVQRFRYIHAKDRISRRLCNAAKKALSKIPTKNIKAEDKEIEGDGECCAICIEPYKISDVIRILPCRHEFHKYCIDPWLLEHRTCPMCKMDILKHYGFVSGTIY